MKMIDIKHMAWTLLDDGGSEMIVKRSTPFNSSLSNRRIGTLYEAVSINNSCNYVFTLTTDAGLIHYALDDIDLARARKHSELIVLTKLKDDLVNKTVDFQKTLAEVNTRITDTKNDYKQWQE